jgi:hypothetical protein
MDKKFSIRLAAVIQAMGMSPTQFARKASIPQGTISKCLSGHVPTARILLRVAKLTGKSVDWLLLGAGSSRGGEGSVSERPARYGGTGAIERVKPADEVWVSKLLKILRSSNRQKTQTIKDLLDVLARDE